MSILVEPYAAIATCNIGTRVQLYGRNSARALEMVQRWQLLTGRGEPIDAPGIRAVSAAVVDPRGVVTSSWAVEGAAVPVPGAPPRWAPLYRVASPTSCTGCGSVRWPGCWMLRDLDGCAECLPAREAADPRCWPVEPAAVVQRVEVVRERTPRKRKVASRTPVVSPGQGRLV